MQADDDEPVRQAAGRAGMFAASVDADDAGSAALFDEVVVRVPAP